MKFRQNQIKKHFHSNDIKYCVLDVETTGVKPAYDDILSIDIYFPHENKHYSRFIYTDQKIESYITKINGITNKFIQKQKPLDIDELPDLRDYIILHYGDLDYTFFYNLYKKNNRLEYFYQLKFYNFKRCILNLAGGFSQGWCTNDNLCKALKIDGTSSVHTGKNDCILEWKLFNKMRQYKNLFAFEDVYRGKLIVHAYKDDYLESWSVYSKRNKNELIKTIKYEEIFTFNFINNPNKLNSLNMLPFEHGKFLEHNLKVSLKAIEQNNSKWLHSNSEPQILGTVQIQKSLDVNEFKYDLQGLVVPDSKLNEILLSKQKQMMKDYGPVVEYVCTNIFNNCDVITQELIKHSNFFMLADFSSNSSVLEIKACAYLKPEYVQQTWYEANGRNPFLLQIDTVNERVVIFKLSYDQNCDIYEICSQHEKAFKEKRLQLIEKQLNERLVQNQKKLNEKLIIYKNDIVELRKILFDSFTSKDYQKLSIAKIFAKLKKITRNKYNSFVYLQVRKMINELNK